MAARLVPSGWIDLSAVNLYIFQWSDQKCTIDYIWSTQCLCTTKQACTFAHSNTRKGNQTIPLPNSIQLFLNVKSTLIQFDSTHSINLRKLNVSKNCVYQFVLRFMFHFATFCGCLMLLVAIAHLLRRPSRQQLLCWAVSKSKHKWKVPANTQQNKHYYTPVWLSSEL